MALVENNEYLESVNQIQPETEKCFSKMEFWNFPTDAWTPLPRPGYNKTVNNTPLNDLFNQFDTK